VSNSNNVKSLALLLCLAPLSGPALSTEEIVVTGSSGDSGPSHYIIDFSQDWVRDLNYQQYLQAQTNDRQRQSQERSRYENERSLARCEAAANEEEQYCGFKAHVARQSNMEKCGSLSNGLSFSIASSRGPSMAFSPSDSYDHCVNMTQMYLSTDMSSCKALAAAARNRCQQEH